jgi:hypothetical protein
VRADEIEAARALALIDGAARRNGRPFAPDTPMRPPAGRRRSWVHYGVMMPGLPEPHRGFGVMSIPGTPGVRIFANDHLIRTSPGEHDLPSILIAGVHADPRCDATFRCPSALRGDPITNLEGTEILWHPGNRVNPKGLGAPYGKLPPLSRQQMINLIDSPRWD